MVISCMNGMQNPPIEDMPLKKLFHANYMMKMPFHLKLDTHDCIVECEELIRLVPGKRLVTLGTWNDKTVVAKLFYERRRAIRHAMRELAGIEILTVSGVPTPKLLYYGTAQKKRVHVLLFEYISESKSLETVWQEKKDLRDLALLMQAVTIELATQHVLGILQHDLHLKNFLLKENQIFTLDAGSIECSHTPLPKKTSLDHLGLFFSQLGVGTEELQQTLFEVYTKARGWLVKKADVAYLEAAIRKWNQRRFQQYESKLTRHCTAFARIAWPQVLIMYDRTYYLPEFKAFLANPENVFQQKNTVILKAGRTSTVAKVTLDNKNFVVKRYNIKNITHWLRRCFRPTRAFTSWRLSHLLRLFGIKTAKPVAFIEKRFLGLRHKSYFVMEYINGAHLGEYFQEEQLKDTHEAVALRIMTLFKNLAKLNMSHGDLKMTNILIENDSPILIDLDGMKEHCSKKETARAYKKEIKRFMQNWTTRPLIKKLFAKWT
ncbi:MAG: hypothetical protein ACD_60C00160G0028 [uncultured bacterium]|nr:MAG: hypothetical protein ACD_60C00160G0028 [uncultured bacterium]